MVEKKIIKEMRDYANLNNVPIILDEGINFLRDYIKKNNIKRILEIGTAIGYSAILMSDVAEDIILTSIERDEVRYLEAIKNIKKANLEERINLIFKDALEVDLKDSYDMIFIDASKAQNIKFFEKFEKSLIDKGTIITDNMNFHGLVDENIENIESRNLRQLVKKIKNYKVFLEENEMFITEFFDIGDGMAVSKRK